MADSTSVTGVFHCVPDDLVAQIGDGMKISADGCLSNPICPAAIEAFKPVILSDADSCDSRAIAGCECPLSDARLTFAIGGSGSLIIT